MRALPLTLLLAAVPAFPLEGDRPRDNDTYVPTEENARVLRLVGDARRAAEAREWPAVADALHALLLSDEDGVVALSERELYAAPRRWAQIHLLAEREPFPAEVLAAWRDAHDREGAGLLAGALRAALQAGDRSSEEAVLRVVDRFPASTATPAVLLALVDRALQRGDLDRARGLLSRSLEHVARSEEEDFRASPAWRARRAALDAARVPARAGWPTEGGGPDRAAAGDPLPDSPGLRLLWQTRFLPAEPHAALLADPDGLSEHGPVLPFSPCVDEQHLYLHLGGAVLALDRATGDLAFAAPPGALPRPEQIDGMILGSPGARGVTLHEGVMYFNRLLFAYDDMPQPRSELVAFDLQTREVRWRVRAGDDPRAEGAVLERPVFFRGAPAVADGRLFVYGAAREFADDEPTRKEQAWIFCFDARGGRLLWQRFLASGDTEAAPLLPPLSGSAPAVAQGTVAVATGMGITAALDAATGEILWLLRYDRQRARERERLKDDMEQRVYLDEGWMRQAPRIVGEDLFFAPFDGDHHYRCWLRGSRRPLDGSFAVVQWARHRAEHPGRNSLLEWVAGLHGGRVWYVGRLDSHHSVESYQAVLGHPIDDETGPIAGAALPPVERDESTGTDLPPEPFGQPVIAGDVLYLPTRDVLWRFALDGVPPEGGALRMLPPVVAPELAGRDDFGDPPGFGNLLAVGGRLYAVTWDRVLCYGPE